TTGKRDKLYPKMERQFQQRIRRDQKFILREIPDGELLAVYQRRLANWLEGADGEARHLVAEPPFQFLPFKQDELLGFCRRLTLRQALEQMDIRFRQYMVEEVTDADPRFEFLVALNELKLAEETAQAYQYTSAHLATVTELMNRAGGMFA